MTDPPGSEQLDRNGDADRIPNDDWMSSPVGRDVTALQTELVARMRGLLAGISEVALVGFPLHPNAGDSLIWLGQLSLFAQLGIRVRVVGEQNAHNAELLQSLPADVAVLVSGGGNFGDLWPTEHHYRERVIEDARTRRVIQMPQSFCFREPVNLSLTQRVVASHPDLTLTWRDRESYESGLRAFPGTRSVLVPDVALALGAMKKSGERRWPIVCISRTDQEGGELRAIPVPEGCQADWNTDTTRLPQKLALRALRVDRRAGHRLLPEPTRQIIYRHYAETTVQAALQVVCSAGVVVSDRLHAHVLCTMLGMPHVMVDTRYGKIRSFIETWTLGNELVALAGSPSQALEVARAQLAASVQG